MRINPISVAYNRQNLRPQNQNKQNQTVSFGNFEDKKADRLTYELLGLSAADDDYMYGFYEYLKDCPFVTVKSAKDIKGKDFLYVVMNRDITDKHENKHRFDELFQYRRRWPDKVAIETGIIDKEPNYLDLLDCVSGICYLHRDLVKAEEDIITHTLRECKRNGIYKRDNFDWNKFVRMSKFNPEEKLVSFEFTKDPFNKDEKPSENLGRIKRYFFNRELQNRQRQHVRYRQILNDFRKEHKLDNNWRTNIDCSTEDGMKRLRLIIELSDKLYDTFFPPKPEPREMTSYEQDLEDAFYMRR